MGYSLKTIEECDNEIKSTKEDIERCLSLGWGDVAEAYKIHLNLVKERREEIKRGS